MTSPCRPGCDTQKGMDAALCSKCIALLPPDLLATLRNAKLGREKKEASSKARAWLAERTGTAVMGVAVQMLRIEVAALYVQTNGCYFGLPNVDPWDEQRDARKYAGPWPVVAHPPCARWCRLAGLVEARYGERFKRGEDGGCFAAALAAVRKWGGVLEHPADTKAWAAHDLPKPRRGAWMKTFCGGWVTQVAQSSYGHQARKLTWLYCFGIDAPPVLNWQIAPHSARLSYCQNRGVAKVRMMHAKERSATPAPFRDLLLGIAKQCKPAGLSDLDHDWPTTMAIGDRGAVPMPGEGFAEKKQLA